MKTVEKRKTINGEKGPRRSGQGRACWVQKHKGSHAKEPLCLLSDFNKYQMGHMDQKHLLSLSLLTVAFKVARSTFLPPNDSDVICEQTT